MHNQLHITLILSDFACIACTQPSRHTCSSAELLYHYVATCVCSVCCVRHFHTSLLLPGEKMCSREPLGYEATAHVSACNCKRHRSVRSYNGWGGGVACCKAHVNMRKCSSTMYIHSWYSGKHDNNNQLLVTEWSEWLRHAQWSFLHLVV